ncbi:MAG: PAS domain S-box protein [Rhodothermales bacterium]
MSVLLSVSALMCLGAAGWSVALWHRHRDGRLSCFCLLLGLLTLYFALELFATPLSWQLSFGGHPAEWVGLIISIMTVPTVYCFGYTLSEREHTVEALRRVEYRNQSFVRALPDTMFRLSRDGRYLDFIPAQDFEPFLPPQDFLGKTMRETMPEALTNQTMHFIEEALRTDQLQRFEYELSLDDKERFFEARLVPDEADSVLAIIREVTQRKQAEEALKESEEQLRLALDAAQMGTWTWHLETGEVRWSHNVERIFGLPSGSFDGAYETYRTLIYPDDLEILDRAINEALSEGTDYRVEHRITWSDGSLHWLEGKGDVFRDASGNPVRMAGTVTDITRHKQAEEALRESEKIFRTVFNHGAIGKTIVSLEGRFLEVNRTICDFYGYTEEEMLQMTVMDVAHPDEREASRAVFAKIVSGELGTASLEKQYRHKDGHNLWGDLCFSLVRDAQGQPKFCIAEVQDITVRKHAEEIQNRLIAELEAKNTELERFTYTVSHDLKSPLITIKGFLGLLQQDTQHGDAERVRFDVEQIGNAADIMLRLLDELLHLSRIGRLINPPEAIDLTDLAHATLDLLAGRIREGNVTVEVAPEMPLVYADRTRLLEVMQNLIDNAIKFMGEQEAPRIEIGARRDRGEVVCYVRDNGLGIAPEDQKKVFGLFSRLDTASEGTGIGLTLVKRIVEVHGGRVWVESEGEGHGATFFFTLPHKQDSAHEES